MDQHIWDYIDWLFMRANLEGKDYLAYRAEELVENLMVE